MTARPLNWTLAALLALLLSSSYLLDGPTDHQSEWASAASLQDAVRAEAQAQRRAQAVAALCGQNAGSFELADGDTQCTTKHGRKTITARVQP